MARTGTSTISSGMRSVEVSSGAPNMILVSLSSNPGNLASKIYSVKQIIKKAASFVVELFSPVEKDTTFDYQNLGATGTVSAESGRGKTSFTNVGLLAGTMVVLSPTSSPAEAVAGDFSPKYIDIDTTLNVATIYFNNILQNDTTYDYYIFSRTSTFTAESGKGHVVVADGTVAANSNILATASSDPGKILSMGFSIKYIEKNPGVGFTVYFNNILENDATFDYVIL